MTLKFYLVFWLDKKRKKILFSFSEICISRRASVQGIIDLVILNLVAMLQNTIFQFNRFAAKKCKKCRQIDEKCQ